MVRCGRWRSDQPKQQPPKKALGDMPADEMTANDATARAKELAMADKMPEALVYFQHAYTRQKSVTTRGNLGMAELVLGQYPLAAKHLREALDKIPEIDRNGTAAKALMGDLVLAEKEVMTLRVDTTQGARVTVDDTMTFYATKKAIYLAPGAHRIVAERKGFTSGTTTVSGEKGHNYVVVLKLDQKIVRGPVSTGASGEPDAGFNDGGKLDGDDGGFGPLGIVAITAGSVTAAGLVASVALTVWANGVESDAQSRKDMFGNACDPPIPRANQVACADLDAHFSESNDAANAALGAWIGTGVLAAVTLTTVVVGLATDDDGKGSVALPVMVAPYLTADAAGVLVGGFW